MISFFNRGTRSDKKAMQILFDSVREISMDIMKMGFKVLSTANKCDANKKLIDVLIEENKKLTMKVETLITLKNSEE